MAVISDNIFSSSALNDFYAAAEIIEQIEEGDKLGWLDNKPVRSEKGCFQGIKRSIDKCRSGYIADGERASLMAIDWVSAFRDRQINLSEKGISLFKRVKTAFEALASTYERLNKEDVSQNYEIVANELQYVIKPNNSYDTQQANSFQSSEAIPVEALSLGKTTGFPYDAPAESGDIQFGMTLADDRRIPPGGGEEKFTFPTSTPTSATLESPPFFTASPPPLPAAFSSSLDFLFEDDYDDPFGLYYIEDEIALLDQEGVFGEEGTPFLL